MSGSAKTAIEAEDLVRIYRRGSEEIRAVDGVSLTIEEGEFVSVIGPSGSGKTTLINVLGCLDNPTSGRLLLDGRPVFDEGRALSEASLTRVRREVFGYIFQKFYLIPTLSVIENVVLPFTFYKKPGASDDVTRVLDSSRHRSSGRTICRASCRAARCSGWPSPGRWSTSPGSCSPTSRRATSTRSGARRSAGSSRT